LALFVFWLNTRGKAPYPTVHTTGEFPVIDVLIAIKNETDLIEQKLVNLNSLIIQRIEFTSGSLMVDRKMEPLNFLGDLFSMIQDSMSWKTHSPAKHCS
jgi:hypothetical protein